MAVARVQNKTATQASGVSNVAAITFDATPTEDNLILLIGSARSGGADNFEVTDAGWNLIESKIVGTSGQLIMYGKIAGAAESATINVRMDNVANTPGFALQALEYSGLIASSWADLFDNSISTAGSSGWTGVCALPDSDDELWVAGFYAQTNGGLITDAGNDVTSVALATTGAIVACRVYELVPGSTGDRRPADADVQMGSSNNTVSGIAMFRQNPAGSQPNTGSGTVPTVTLDHHATQTGSAGSVIVGWPDNADGALLYVFIRVFASGGIPVTIGTPAGWSVVGPITQPDADAMYLFYRTGAPAAFGNETFTFSAVTAFLACRGDYSGVVGGLIASATHGHQGGVGGGVSTGGTTFWSGMTAAELGGQLLFLGGIGLRRTVAGVLTNPTNGYSITETANGNGNYIATLDRTSTGGGYGEVTCDCADPGVGAGMAQMTGIIAAFSAGAGAEPGFGLIASAPAFGE